MLELIILIVAFVLLILVIVWLPILRQGHKVELVCYSNNIDGSYAAVISQVGVKSHHQ